jgi:hypothetical protein
MSPEEFTALKELLGEQLYYFSIWVVGNSMFLIPLGIGLFLINRKYKKYSKAKKLDPPDQIS